MTYVLALIIPSALVFHFYSYLKWHRQRAKGHQLVTRGLSWNSKNIPPLVAPAEPLAKSRFQPAAFHQSIPRALLMM